MLAGEPPYSGPNTQSVIAKLMTERPSSLRTLRDTVPVAMDSAVLAALAKAPADRFAGAEAFVAALQSATVAESAPAAVAVPSSPKNKVALIGVAALAIGAIVVGLVAITGRGPSETLPQTRRQLTLTGTADLPALSPDVFAKACSEQQRMTLSQF